MSIERERPVRVLMVCTANRCRSPMAEVLLARHLEEVGVPAEVRSCGRLGDGTPVDRLAVAAMRERLLDLEGRRSRRLGDDDVMTADLIITMERAHLLDVAEIDPSARSRTFTLPELTRRSLRVGRRHQSEPLARWIERVRAGGSSGSVLDHPLGLGVAVDIALGVAPDTTGDITQDTLHDIADPIGGSIRDFRACAAVIDGYLEQLVEQAFDPLRHA